MENQRKGYSVHRMGNLIHDGVGLPLLLGWLRRHAHERQTARTQGQELAWTLAKLSQCTDKAGLVNMIHVNLGDDHEW